MLQNLSTGENMTEKTGTRHKPSLQDQRVAVRLKFARDILDVVQQESELRERLGAHGYDAERLAEGRRLLEGAERAYARRQHQLGAVQAADAAQQTAFQNVRRRYVALRRTCRVVFTEPGQQIALGVTGKIEDKLDLFLPLCALTYNTILNNPTYGDLLGTYGFTLERLQSEKDSLDALVGMIQNTADTRNQAELATRERNSCLNELVLWLVRLRSIALDATADRPDLAAKINI